MLQLQNKQNNNNKKIMSGPYAKLLNSQCPSLFIVKWDSNGICFMRSSLRIKSMNIDRALKTVSGMYLGF